MSGSISSAVTLLTYRVTIPKGSRSPNKSIVPPKRPALAITSSPDSRMFRSAIVTAAIPDEHATAPTPFSMEAILFSKDVTVGLPIRVGVAGSSVVEHLFKLFGRAVRKCTDLINGS